MSGWRAEARSALLPAFVYCLTLLAIALMGGGWLVLGRVDPLLAVPGAGWAAVVAVWATRGKPIGWTLLVSAGAGAILLGAIPLIDAMDGLRSGEWIIAAIALIASAQIIKVVAHRGAALADQRRWAQRVVAFIGLPLLAIGWTALAWPMVGNAYRIGLAPEQRPRVVWVTSLPIGDLDSTSLEHGESQDERDSGEDPIALFLSRTTRDRRFVTIDAAALADADVLLLAHPPALDPAQLVAIDDWVRAGGRAVVLADGLSSWPPGWPLGDPRNSPVTSLLGPLLAHWGVELSAPEGLSESLEIIHDSGQRLETLSAGRFRQVKPGCILRAAGLIGDCRVGRGRVVLLADADLLDPALWAGNRGGANGVDWRSGNMLWLLDKLSGDGTVRRGHSLARPSWSRSRSAIVPSVTARQD